MRRLTNPRAAIVVVALAAALIIPASAAAKVRLIHVTSPISHGSYATLTVSVSRPATCSITVYYKSGASTAAGLYPKHGSHISWSWKVGTRTTPGRWPITVACGSAGTLNTSFRVT